MGNAAGVSQSMQSDRVIVDAILSIRPDLAGKSDSDIISHVKNDLLLAREAHESMPIGFTLKEHEGSSKESIHGKISKVGHICRVVKDADISVKFYRNVN